MLRDSGTVWSFKTKRFEIRLEIERDYNYQYDGDDENGEVQSKLDSGEFVAFDSSVIVFFDGDMIAWDSLCGSVYDYREISEFWQAHRGPDPMDRNCSEMRAARGNIGICHYFPDMVRSAVKDARKYMHELAANLPKVRNPKSWS